MCIGRKHLKICQRKFLKWSMSAYTFWNEEVKKEAIFTHVYMCVFLGCMILSEVKDDIVNL